MPRQVHVGEVVTSLHKCALVPGGAEAIIYVTVGQSIYQGHCAPPTP